MLLFLQEEKEEIPAEAQVTLAVAPHPPLQLLEELVCMAHSQDMDCGLELLTHVGYFLHIRLWPKFLHLCLVLPSKSINYLKQGKENTAAVCPAPLRHVC